MLYRQAGLSSDSLRLVANLNDVQGLRAGKYVTLSDHQEPERRWRVDWLASGSREHGALDRERRGVASWTIK